MADEPLREEKLHGRALDTPALGDAVEEPRAVIVHHELEGVGEHWGWNCEKNHGQLGGNNSVQTFYLACYIHVMLIRNC